MKHLEIMCLVSLLAASLACTRTDQEKAQRDADEARAKAQQTAHQAGQEMKQLGHQVKGKTDHLALVAQVKSKLASDAGLSTVTNVSVDATGRVVTLNGTVNSEEQKHLAEEAAMQVNGVSKVIDNLNVRPE
jgi:osmotically-inducible protein OsmY